MDSIFKFTEYEYKDEIFKFFETYCKAVSPPRWYLMDKVLYDMCKEYPNHSNEHEVVAKIAIIGRAYSASIERRKNAKESEGKDFYYDCVAPFILESELDDRLAELRQYSYPSDENRQLILSTHNYLQELMRKSTDMNKRSLASKYLHFHLPNLYYIYDSQSDRAMNKIIYYKTGWVCPIDADYTYAKYFDKSLFIQEQVSSNACNFPRILDSFLQMKFYEFFPNG